MPETKLAHKIITRYNGFVVGCGPDNRESLEERFWGFKKAHSARNFYLSFFFALNLINIDRCSSLSLLIGYILCVKPNGITVRI